MHSLLRVFIPPSWVPVPFEKSLISPFPIYMYVLMYVCMYVFMYVCMYVCIFCWCTFKYIIFVIVVNAMNKIFQEHFLDKPVFRLVAILKSINKIFEKHLQRKPFLT